METLFYIYLASLIVGGVVVLLSALGGLGADVDVDLDAGADFDAGGDLDADAGDAAHGIGVLSFLKIRRLFYFAFFFGLTGVLVGLSTPPWPTLVTALAAGGLLAWLGDWIITRMSRSSASSGLEAEEFIGLEAVLTIPFSSGGHGKIAGEVKGHTFELLAQPSRPDLELTPGSRVLVLEMRDGVAVVDAES